MLAAVTILAFFGLQLALIALCGSLGRPIPPGCAAASAGIAVVLLLGFLTSRTAIRSYRRVIDSVRHRFLRLDEIEVKSSIQRVKADNYRLAGSLEALPFAIVVQSLHAAWQTGVLLVDFEGTTGRVYFDKGRITEIRYGPHVGPAAFSLMYQDPGGAFFFQPVKRMTKKGDGHDVIGLLTDASRRQLGADASVHRSVRPPAELTGRTV